MSTKEQEAAGKVRAEAHSEKLTYRSCPAHGASNVLQPKTRQSHRIREIRDELVASGFTTIDHQAKVLGLSRSTTWSVLRGNHKNSGISVTLVNRMLAAKQLPARVRAKIKQYAEEKAAGAYGHSRAQRSRFVTRLAVEQFDNQFDDIQTR